MMNAREVIARAIAESHLLVSDGRYRLAAEAALTTLEAAGMAIVPVEATDDHVMRALSTLKGKTWATSFYPADIRLVHAAMIAAAKDQTDD